jgi:glycosyltransferase involved in cell wall biosynthesis
MNARNHTLKHDASKTVLCIAHIFPPVAEAGVHRTRAVVRHLPAHGWQPVVVTARPDSSFREDASLLAGLPDDLKVYRTPAPQLLPWASNVWAKIRRLTRFRRAAATVPANPRSETCASQAKGGWIDWASWWLQVPDLALGWLPWGLLSARREAKRHACQVLYTSAPPFTAHLIGLLTKRLTRIPWVADFRDPWVGNPFRSKIPYRSVQRYDAWLERLVVRHADWIICNCEPVRQQFQARYPDWAARFITIPNGFEPEDYCSLNARRLFDDNKVVLTHAGVFYGPRRPHNVFEALRLLGEDDPECNVHLQLVGSPTYEGEQLNAIAQRYGVADRVHVRGEVSHREALELLRGSDVQVLVGCSGNGSDLQVPGKLFEYLGIGRKILALAPQGSAIAQIMTAGAADGEVCDPESAPQIAATIRRMTSVRSTNGEPPISAAANLQFTRREQVRQIAQLFDMVAASSRNGRRAANPQPSPGPLERELAACRSA